MPEWSGPLAREMPATDAPWVAGVNPITSLAGGGRKGIDPQQQTTTNNRVNSRDEGERGPDDAVREDLPGGVNLRRDLELGRVELGLVHRAVAPVLPAVSRLWIATAGRCDSSSSQRTVPWGYVWVWVWVWVVGGGGEDVRGERNGDQAGALRL